MGIVKAQVSVSADGFVAGPNQSEGNPLGEGGMALHEWVFKLDFWNEQHGREPSGDPQTMSNRVLADATANVGAVVMGRNMFGPVRGEWGDSEWRGWWGDDPPFHTPVFVLTHHAHDPIEVDGGTVFHFVTDGVESAVAQAKAAAGDADVSIGGGASTLRQCMNAGLLDELLVNEVPLRLGAGEPLFDGLDSSVALTPAGGVSTPEVEHLFYTLSS
jgi:dihydrofolate reductase